MILSQGVTSTKWLVHTSPWAQDRFIYGSMFFSWPHFRAWDPFPFVRLFTSSKQSARHFLIPSPWPPTVPSSFFMAPSSGHTRFSSYFCLCQLHGQLSCGFGTKPHNCQIEQRTLERYKRLQKASACANCVFFWAAVHPTLWFLSAPSVCTS